MDWYYADESGGQHPVVEDSLPALVASGRISAGTLLWNETLDLWRPAALLRPDLFSGTLAPPLLTPAQRREIGYPVGPAFPGQRAPVDSVAVCSLVFGILSVLLCGPVCAIPAVICGHLGRKRAREENLPSSNGGLSLAGLITGYLGLVIFVVTIAFYVVFIAIGLASEMDEFTPTDSP